MTEQPRAINAELKTDDIQIRYDGQNCSKNARTRWHFQSGTNGDRNYCMGERGRHSCYSKTNDPFSTGETRE